MQKNFKNALVATTALFGITLAQPALAVNYTVPPNLTSTVVLGNGDSLSVAPGGSVAVPGFGAAVVTDNATSALIDNQGTLSSAFGLVIRNIGGDVAGGIVNAGSMTGQAGIAVVTGGRVTGGITNSGTLSTINNSIVLNDNATVSGGLLNTGTISGADTIFINSFSSMGDIVNHGSISSSGGGGRALFIVNDAAVSSLTNTGTITTLNGETVFVGTSSFINGDVINSGSIIASGGAGIGVYSNSAITGTIRNSGTISGSIGIAMSDGEIRGGIINEAGGIIEGTSGNAITVNSFSSAVIVPLTINGGRIIGSVRDNTISKTIMPVTVGGDFTSEGDFDVDSIDILAGKTFTVGAGYTLAMNSLAFGAAGTGSAAQLVVSSGAIDLTGIDVSVRVSGNAFVDGDEFRVGNGTAAIIGGPGGVRTAVADNSLLWNFEMADGTAAAAPTDNTDLFLFVTASSSPLANLFGIVQGFDGGPDAGAQNAVDNLNSATTEQEQIGILSTLQPPADGGVQQGAQAFSEASFGVTGDHLDDLSDETGIATGDPWKALRAWGQVFGQTADQGSRGSVGGFDADTAGFALGVESETLFDRAVAGISLGYGRTNVDNKSATNASNGSVDIDSYQLGLYGQANLGNRVYLRGMASYSFNNNDSARYNVGGAGGPTAVADFDASQYALRLETGRSYAAGYAVLTPSLMANVLHYSPDSYTETGAGGLNLTVSGKDVTIAELGAGLKAKWEYKQDDGSKFLPELHGGYRYDLVGDAVEATSAFTGGGGSFSTTGSSPARSRFNFGAGLTYQTSSSWELHAGYDLDLKQDYHAHSGTVRASIRF